MRLVCISDTHNFHEQLGPLPDGDVLVHAGDCTGNGTLPEVTQFLDWFAQQPHHHKVLVAGNHDWLFAKSPSLIPAVLPPNVTYLQDSGAVLDGKYFWGSPWQPEFNGWAFNLPRLGAELAFRWASIPVYTHVLVTHGPPYGVLDQLWNGQGAGCEQLAQRLPQLPSLQAHVFGHVHEGYGAMRAGGPWYVNASVCNEAYVPCRAPHVVDLE